MLQGHETLMLKNEVAGLRSLVRGLRTTFEGALCECDEMKDAALCRRCAYLDIIDRALARIARQRINESGN
jgi:hypothetical protein